MARLDPHSWTNSDQPQADHLTWGAHVDFSRRVLQCEARLLLRQPTEAEGPLDLDTRGLTVHSVIDAEGRRLPFVLSPPDPIVGARLRIDLQAGAREVIVAYETSPDASALQWLAQEQTAGGTNPFLYSQCQPIHARSLVPLQDTPGTRLRYSAELRVPRTSSD